MLHKRTYSQQGYEEDIYASQVCIPAILVTFCNAATATCVHHIHQQYSHLFHQASPPVATFLATDHPNVVGSYLKTCLLKDKLFWPVHF